MSFVSPDDVSMPAPSAVARPALDVAAIVLPSTVERASVRSSWLYRPPASAEASPDDVEVAEFPMIREPLTLDGEPDRYRVWPEVAVAEVDVAVATLPLINDPVIVADPTEP